MFDTSIYQQGRGLRSGLQTGAAIGGMISDYNANNAVKEAALQIQNGANREQVIQGLMAQDPKAAQSLMNMLGGGQALQQNDQSLERGVQEIQALTQKVGMQSMQSAAMPLFGALFANDDKSRNSLIAEAANVFVKSSPATAEMILGIKDLPDEQKAGALSGIVKTLRQSGIFPDDPSTMNSQPADVSKFEYWKSMNPDATPEEARAVFDRIIDPYARAQSQADVKVGTEKKLNDVLGERTGKQETAKLEAQIISKPKVDAAVESAVAEARDTADMAKGARSNETALSIYNTAMGGLADALGGTGTGYWIGRIPAFGTNAQIAEGSIATIVPVLKQIFRTAGEGTFTDKDQEVLLAMVPKRTDSPEAAKAKIEMLDNVVMAKLGGGKQQAQPVEQQPAQQQSNVGRFTVKVK